MCSYCKCPHHLITKLLIILAWAAAIGFWWTEWKVSMIWWMDSEHLFKDVIILSLLAFSSKFCQCCSAGKKMTESGKMGEGMSCKHEEGCRCGDCGRCK